MALDQPHHDPSIRYVSNPDPDPGETVELRVTMPAAWRGSEVHLRTVVDGEAHYEKPAGTGDPKSGEVVFEMTCDQPVQNYRFHLRNAGRGSWLNGAGLVDFDPDDHGDFKLVPGRKAPDWVPERVWYQIFPDRFETSGNHSAASGSAAATESWINWAEWDDPLITKWPASMTQFFGGDMDGIVQRLDHITDLGIGGIYLTPIFPARSNHRYDASTFDVIDPLLGGEEALLRLRRACDDAGLKLMTDLTLNHTGDAHEWFKAARSDAQSEEAGFYHFIDHPETYESWLGVDSLPKLDHRNREMARRLYAGPSSVVSRYMTEPYNLDGWRIDVANMTGRLRELDINQDVARTTRATFDSLGESRWLLGEHFFDATADTPGDGWHGVMNYAGISRPIASWLGKSGTLHGMSAGPGQDARDGVGMARSFDVVRSAMAWTVMMGSMGLLSSHDTARWRTMCVSDDAAQVGFGMLLALPGAPCFFYGDEIGMTGGSNDESRAPMPWNTPETWDEDFLTWYRTVIRARNSSPALQQGGFRWVHTDADQLVWLREGATERVLIRASRAAGAPVELSAAVLGSNELAPLVGDHRARGNTITLPADGPRFDAWVLG